MDQQNRPHDSQFFQNNSPLFLQIFATESRYRITKTPLFTNCLFHFLSLQSHNLVEKTYTYTAYTEPEYQWVTMLSAYTGGGTESKHLTSSIRHLTPINS